MAPQCPAAFPPGIMHLLCVLMVLLTFGGPPTRSHSPREPRATYARSRSQPAIAESLLAYDCLASGSATQVVAYPGQHHCDTFPSAVRMERRTFDVFQLRKTVDTRILTCSLTISRMIGRCGMSQG